MINLKTGQRYLWEFFNKTNYNFIVDYGKCVMEVVNADRLILKSIKVLSAGQIVDIDESINFGPDRFNLGYPEVEKWILLKNQDTV